MTFFDPNICLCCGSGLKTDKERLGQCFLCGATQEACRLLIKHNLDPWDQHQYLSDRKRYFALTLRIAEVIVQVYETERSKEQ